MKPVANIRPSGRFPWIWVIVATAGVAILAAIWIVTAVALERRFEAEMRFRERANAQLARLLEGHALRTLTDADQMLRRLATRVDREGFTVALSQEMHQFGTDRSLYAHLSVADQHGIVRADQYGIVQSDLAAAGTNVDISDREYFRLHQASADAGLYISKPVVGRMSGRKVILLVRRVSAADGSFKGVVIASVSPDYFSDFFSNVDAGPRGVVALLGLDRAVRAEHSPNPGAARFTSEALWDRAAGRSEGAFIDEGDNHARRMIAYRRVGDLPLVIVVASDVEDVSAAVSGDATRDVAGAMGATAIVLIALLGLSYGLWKQRTALRALQESEMRFSAAFNQSAVGMAHSSLDGHLIAVNPRLAALAQMPVAAMEGCALQAVLPAEVHGQMVEDLELLRRGEIASASREVRLSRPFGSKVWLRVATSLARHAGGDPSHFLHVVTDVTAEKEAEERLVESRNRLALALRGSHVAAWTSQLPEGTVHFTAEWSEMLGGPAVETTTTVAELLALIHPEDLPAIRQTSGDLVTGVRSGYRIQHRVRNRAGEWIWIDSAGSVSDRDPAGHVLRVVGTNTDISELKRVQHDLEAAKQDLEERVGSRTIALGRLNDILKTQIKQEIAAQEELKLAKEAAEAANTAKSEFLANMSHEIRTPMHGILGLTELVLAGDIGSEERDHLKLVSDSGRVLLQLIDDLLDFSKIEAGRLELEAVDFSPAACVEEVIRLMAARAEAKRIRLQSRPGEGVPQWIVGDPVRFRQILFNLVGNAVKFTERGSVEIVMGVVGSADPQLARREAELQIAVVDTGIGILEDKLTTIFQPFTQADSSMTRRFGGTGLGLAITAKLCTMMGGSIRVDSELGKGSTFHVRLPVRLPQPADMASKAPEQVSFVVPSEEVSSDRVALVAEDNPVNQRLALKILERLGYRVIIAVDGRQAVESYFAQRPDVILMDVQMPLMDGLTATAQIRDGERDLPGAPRVPIIGLTANALPGDRERCLAAGMDDYLPKPFNAAALRAMIDRWLVSL